MSLSNELIERIPDLRAFAISLCGDREKADDLVQETLTRAWANQDKFAIGTNLRAWLFTILRNAYFSEYRKWRRETNDAENIISGMESRPEQVGHMEYEDFRRALATLPETQREALILVGASGFSYEETAEIAGCAVGTVKSRVNRARMRLAELLSIELPKTPHPDEPATDRSSPHAETDEAI
jgi:RNA polymerase sigma-70 factor (ECF subfamily)